MSSITEINCPVCRAKQDVQSDCRRCGADLSLWLKALHSLQRVQHQVTQAEATQQVVNDKWLDYLKWLSPNAARSADRLSSTNSPPRSS